MNQTLRRPLLSKTFLDEHKRERCAMGLSAAVHKVGVHRLTVAMVTRHAKMARTTFYELFRNQEEALEYASDLGSRLLREAIESAGSEGRREERMDAAIRALISTAQSNPDLIELYLVHGISRLTDQGLVEALAAVLAEDGAGGSVGTDPVFAELLAQSILSPIAERLRRGEPQSLTTLSGPLAEFVRIQLGDLLPDGSSQSIAPANS